MYWTERGNTTILQTASIYCHISALDKLSIRIPNKLHNNKKKKIDFDLNNDFIFEIRILDLEMDSCNETVDNT